MFFLACLVALSIASAVSLAFPRPTPTRPFLSPITMAAEKFKDIVKSLPMFAGQSATFATPLKTALEDIDQWFELTKQAFQQHYERRMKLWSFILSLVVVMMLNADIVGIYKEFKASKAMRDAAVAAVPSLLDIARRESTQVAKVPSLQNIARKDSAQAVIPSTKTMTLHQSDSLIKHQLALIETLATTKSFDIFRWNTPTGDSLRFSGTGGGLAEGTIDFISALSKNFIGWLGMILLVSLGAPFWYDFLKTLMGVKDKLKQKT